MIGRTAGDAMEDGLKQPLLISPKENQQDDDDNEGPEMDCDDETAEENHKPATSMVAAYRLLTPSIKVLSRFLNHVTLHLQFIMALESSD